MKMLKSNLIIIGIQLSFFICNGQLIAPSTTSYGNGALSVGFPNNNTAFGAFALKSINPLSPGSNTAIGSNALRMFNLQAALNYGASGSNTAVGTSAMQNELGGSSNTAIGYKSMQLSKSSGNLFNNVAIGAFSLHSGSLNNEVCSENIAIGYSSLFKLRAGNDNTVIGYQSLSSAQSTSYNTIIGYHSFHKTLNGNNNIGLGVRNAFNNINGSSNIIIGNNSMSNLISGSHNISIGNSSSFMNDISNSLIIGGIIRGTNVYSSSGGRIGIGLPLNLFPQNKLEITHGYNGYSGLRFTNLTSNFIPSTRQISTKFLTVDVNGDVILSNMSNLNTSNIISSTGNIMTSNVNSISDTANIVNSISNSINFTNQLVTTVNGISSNPVSLPNFVEVDGSITNELQTLSQAGNTVTLSNGGGSFNLPTFTDTDAQSLALVGNNLTISNGNTVVLPTFVEVDGSVTNELQTLSQAGNTVTLSNGGGSFNLPTFTDTDAQSLELVGNNLTISNGNTVVLPTFVEVDGSVTNELQTLSQAGNTVTLSNGGGSFTMPTTTVTAGANVTVTGNGSSSTPYIVSSINTDAQSLALVGNNLTISNGNTIVLPTFVEVDGSVTNELQTLSQAGNTVTLSNGGGSFTMPTTSIIAGTNTTVSGNGSASTPFQINAIDTSIYANNGIINQATTTGNNRVVDMNNRNIWFNTTTSSTNGKIYLGSTSVYPNSTGNYKLFVEGGIMTEKIKVALRSTANWADYVFDKNYKLMSLLELEKYISTNKHLPGIESANELTKNGIDVTDMQSKQMAKIEELTLYIINQNKTLVEQSKAISMQNKEIEALKTLMDTLIDKTK